MTLLQDEGFIQLKSRDARIVSRSRQASATQISQSYWKSCLQVREWQALAEYAWPFLPWYVPTHVTDIGQFLQWNETDLLDDFLRASFVRVKNEVLERKEWTWLPAAPYVGEVKDELFKIAAAACYKAPIM